MGTDKPPPQPWGKGPLPSQKIYKQFNIEGGLLDIGGENSEGIRSKPLVLYKEVKVFLSIA